MLISLGIDDSAPNGLVGHITTGGEWCRLGWLGTTSPGLGGVLPVVLIVPCGSNRKITRDSF